MSGLDVAATRYAGARINRVEDGRLLTGAGTFVDDISRPGMLHACFVRSPFARARIEAIDTSEALAVPGVRAVFVAADLNPDVREQWYTLTGPKMPDIVRPPLAEHEVRFVGRPGRAGRGRESLPRRGRRGAGRRRLRAAAGACRLHHRRVERRARVRERSRERRRPARRGAAGDHRRDRRDGGTRRQRDDLPAVTRSRADRDAWVDRRVGRGER